MKNRLLLCVLPILLCLSILFAGCGRLAPPGGGSSSEADSAAEEPEELPEEPEAPATVVVVVPEGYTLARIGMTLEELGVCTVKEFIAAAQEDNYRDFPLVAEIKPDERRCYTLEGYLFPATYEIYPDESPGSIIRRMLTATEQSISAELREDIRNSGYTLDEILTIASIIEKEAFGKQHMPGISAVLHNRLEIEMPLQCDVTITYVEGAIKPFIELGALAPPGDGDMDYYSEYYNTYKCQALPAGPICNSSIEAVRAALFPAESDNLFFVTDADKNYYYAATWDEHLANVEKAGL